MSEWVVVNGRFVREGVAALSPGDRGFVLGDSIFTTLVASPRAAFGFDAHWQRLERGARTLGLRLPERAALASMLLELVQRSGFERAIVRPQVSRGPHPGRGLAVALSRPLSEASGQQPGQPAPAAGAGVPPTVIIRAFAYQPYPEAVLEEGVPVVISAIRRNESSPLLAFKTPFNYGDALLARWGAVLAGAADALFLNTRGEVACATAANLFCVLDGALWTPPEAAGAMCGVTRAFVLGTAPRFGLPAGERPLSPADLFRAEELFLTDTVGVRPVVAVDGMPIGTGRPGPWARRLANAYREALGALL